MRPAIGYKILTAAQFTVLRAGNFTGAPVDMADGYIHLSTAGQLAETVRKHFTGQTDLVVAAVDLATLGNAVKWEISRGGAEFPHLYGTLTMAHVTAYGPVVWAGDEIVLPT
ncbi:MAG: DUF952 domain-containing protein [Acidocella sp.]|nr:DUF952 domain-containing protein [Acidocella sp.]